jgi:hypothetical protein
VEERESYVGERGANDCAGDQTVPKHRALVQDLAPTDLSLAVKNLIFGANTRARAAG